MFESVLAAPAGVYRVDPADPRLPADALVALLDAAPELTGEDVRRFAAVDPAALSRPARISALRVWARIGSWVAAAEARALVAVAGPEDDTPAGRLDCTAEEVAAATGLAPATAQRRIAVARALTGRLQATGALLAAGRLRPWYATHLAERTADRSDGVAAAVEAAVLPAAPTLTYGQFTRAVAQALAAADQAGLEQRHAAGAAARGVRLWPEGDGLATLQASGPAPALYQLYNTLTARGQAAKTAGDPRTADARRFDALAEIAAAAAADPATPTAHGRRPQVGILLDLPTALGLTDHPGELAGYGPIPASLARAHAADADWQAWLLDAAHAHLIALGVSRYRPSQALTDLIIARDRTCRQPGCTQPAWRCDIDHATPHEHGGCTDPDNCGAFCRRHHRIKTDPDSGWTIHRDPDGTVHHHTPAGFHYTVPLPTYTWMLHPPDPPADPEPPPIPHLTTQPPDDRSRSEPIPATPRTPAPPPAAPVCANTPCGDPTCSYPNCEPPPF